MLLASIFVSSFGMPSFGERRSPKTGMARAFVVPQYSRRAGILSLLSSRIRKHDASPAREQCLGPPLANETGAPVTK